VTTVEHPEDGDREVKADVDPPTQLELARTHDIEGVTGSLDCHWPGPAAGGPQLAARARSSVA
jgi:hypothetical protein